MLPANDRQPKLAAWRWVTLAIVLSLTARLLYQARGLQTAPGMLRVLARDATLGWIGLGHRPIDQQDAARQAEFWLAETERVLDAHPSSESTRGAAWMLDSPGHGFYFRHLRRSPIPQMPVELNQEAVEAEVSQFTRLTEPRCLHVAELATQLAPNNVDAWRTRSTLLFNPLGKPRADNWIDVLTAASARDPDNALYDYLQANSLWQQHVTVDDNGVSSLADPAILEQCLALFARGQQKNYFPATLADWPVILAFLERTSVPRHEHPAILNSRQLQSRTNLLEFGLVQLKTELSQQQPPLDQLTAIQECSRLASQVASSGDLSGIGTAMTINKALVARLDELLAKQRANLPADAVTKAEELRMARARQTLVWETASKRLAPASSASTYSIWNHLQEITVKAALQSCILLFALAALCGALARGDFRAPAINLPTDLPRLGLLSHVACWILAFTLSAATLGWGASHVHDLASQGFFARTLIIATAVVGLTIVALIILSLSGWRFSLRQLLVGPVLLGAVIALFGALGAPLLGDIDPAVLHAAFPTFAPGSLAWGLIQFTTYAGPTVALILALTFVGFLAIRRNAARIAPAQPRDWKAITRRVSAEVGRSAAGAGLIAFLLFLLLAPGHLQAIERDYNAKLAWLVDLDVRRSQLAEQIRAVEADPNEMAKIRKLVEQQVRPAAP